MTFSMLDNSAVGLVAILLYAASAWLLYRSVAHSSGDYDNTEHAAATTGTPSSIWLLALSATLIHAMMLIGSTLGPTGLNFSFFNSLSVTAWLAVVLTLLLNMGKPVINLGLFLFPMAAAALALSLFFASRSSGTVASGMQWHVLTSVIAYALLTISSGQALLVSLQDKRLKARNTGGILRALPPLKTMEAVLFQLLLSSFVFLSLSLATGFIFLDDLFAQRLVHKTTLSLVAWLLMTILLIGHLRWGWRGQKAAGFTLGAFVSLLLGYFGSKFVIELLLSPS